MAKHSSNDKTPPARRREPPTPAPSGGQQGGGRSIALDEELKHAVRQHPQRDEPRVDGVEPEEPPAP